MVLIGGFIGYITNKVAIKMLFRPVNPIKILGFTIQGVFPKRKDEMAKSLAETIEKELLNKDEIINQIVDGMDIDSLKEKIKATLIEKISASIPPMAKMFLGDNVGGMISDFVDKNGDAIMDDLIDKIKKEAGSNIDIYALVKERIDALDFIEFEQIVFGLINKELRHIELIGLILGMLIGVVQFFVTLISI
jgi:uncharacterized membrane protein YheB (UPF0754 family)